MTPTPSRWTVVLSLSGGARYALVIMVATSVGRVLAEVGDRMAAAYAKLGVEPPPHQVVAILAGAHEDAMAGVIGRNLGIIHSDPWEGA